MSRGWLYGLTAALCIVILGGALLLSFLHGSAPAPQMSMGAREVDLCREVQADLHAAKFDELDRMGRQFSALQDRFEGGGEKLVRFYESLGLDGCGVNFCQARAVQPENFRKLQDWLNQDPKSGAAKIAMALNWYYYAWMGRGCAGWADVTFDQWQVFFDRMRIARAYLNGVDPRAHPYYYALMMDLLIENGGPRAEIDASYEEGHTAFPDFYALPMRYARALDSKWYGRDGDVVWLADTLLSDPGGDRGLAAYSFVAEKSAELVDTQHFFPQTGLSWDRVKQGFATRRQLYGLSNHDWNAYCYLAYAAADRDVCREAIAHYGENVDWSLWRDPGIYASSVLPWIKGQ